jgi:transposase
MRATIQALARTGATNKEVAIQVDCSEATVKRWKFRHGVCDSLRTGRPSILTPQDKDEIQDMMRDVWGSSLRNTSAVLNSSAAFREQGRSVSPWTVRNYLRTTTWGRVAYKGTVKPFLSTKNIQDRIRFCEMAQREGYCQATPEGRALLEHIMFTDEAPIVLSPLPNRHNNRIRTSSIDMRVIQKYKKGLSIMVAGGMSSGGLTDLHIVDHRSTVNGDYYRGRIVPCYAVASRVNGEGSMFTRCEILTFQQDGAPAHTAVATMRLLQETFPRVWGKNVWPGNSPDLNPIEHLWAVLQESVFDHPRPGNRQELIQRVTERWNNLRLSSLPRTLAHSFPKRIDECLRKGGKHTSY